MESKEALLPHQEHEDDSLPKEEPVTFLSIFKFSSQQDRVYMAVGTLTSILAGITFPFFLMFFGQVTDVFTDKDSAADKGLYIMF